MAAVATKAIATLAAGCFWGVELTFQKTVGVLATEVSFIVQQSIATLLGLALLSWSRIVAQVGYTGGLETAKNPTYEQICRGNTNHAEAVRIEFDPEQVTYVTSDAWRGHALGEFSPAAATHILRTHRFAELLDVFFENHDPTTVNRQGPDVGTQYRSAIFFHDETQKTVAEESIKKWSGKFSNPIVTQVVEAGEWWAAEDYHQKDLEKKGHDA